MIGRFNLSCKPFVRILALAGLIVAAHVANAQVFKKKAKRGDVAHTEYAYQTYSTLSRKQKVYSHGGSTDPKFHVEKPVRPTPYRNGRAVNTRSDSFGPKSASGRRSSGKSKGKKKPSKKRGKKG
jgi:hypothetical protein